jgi:GTP-binding protein YchF
MSYKIGLVGLPNAGKSSLFNFLTKKNVLAENYPFATIEPNVGMMILEDDRLEKIKKILNSKKIVNESIKIIDIAGLVKGASEGKGLGNEFLSHIRGVDLVCHVLRCFKDKNIIHVENEINPIKDYETIAMEIILSDLQQVEKILKKLKVRNDEDKEEKFILEKAKSVLEEGMMIKNCIFSEEEKKILKKYSLITSKSSILLLNYGESDETSETQEIKKYSEKNSLENFSINVRVEKELDNLTKEEKIDFG